LKKILVLLIITAVLLCGCDLFNNRPVATETLQTMPEISDEPSPYPVIIDGVIISEPPERITCLSPVLCEILHEFGEEHRIIGRSDYCDYPAQIRGIQSFGSGINLEVDRIIKAAPDLLITSSPVSAMDRKTLELEGIAVVVIPNPKNLDEFKNVYRIIGVILHGGFVGEEEGERTFSVISRVCDNPNVVKLGNFVYITENLALATGDTLESSVISCFGNNLAVSGAGYIYDKSKLLVTQPDVIILNSNYTIEDLLEDEYYSQLDAVIDERVIIIDNTFFERPTARIISVISLLTTEFNAMRS